MAEKKKRSRDPLGVNAHEERRKKQDPDVSLAYLKEGNATNKKRKDEVAPRTQRHNIRMRKASSEQAVVRRKRGGYLSSEKKLESAFNAPFIVEEEEEEEEEEDEEEEDEEEEEEEEEEDVDEEGQKRVKKTRVSDGHFESARRGAFSYLFEYIYGCPLEAEGVDASNFWRHCPIAWECQLEAERNVV